MHRFVPVAIALLLFGAPTRARAQKPPSPPPEVSVVADAGDTAVDPDREARRALRWWRSQGLSTLVGPSVVLSPVYQTGGSVDIRGTGPTERVAGLRYEEHGGMVAGLLAGLATMVGAYAVAGMPSSVHYGPVNESTTYHADGSRTIRRSQSVTATYDDLEGRQAMIDGAPDAIGAGALIESQSLLVEVFFRNAVSDIGDGYGYRTRLMLPMVRNRHVWLEGGVGFQSILTLDSEAGLGRKSVVRGTPLFLHVPFGWAYATLGVDMNWSSLLFDDSKRDETVTVDGRDYFVRQSRRWPVTMALTANLWRLQVRAAVESDGFRNFGYQLSAGVRF